MAWCPPCRDSSPRSPTFTTTSEREVWERLRDGLGEDDVLLANLRLTDEDKDHEADLVVLMPDVGILVLEVKGGSVWYDDDGWWIKRRGRDTRDRPGRPGARREVRRCGTTSSATRAGAAATASPGRTAW